MYDAPGIGLAAIQVGVPRRLVVIDVVEGRGGARAAGSSSIPRSSGRPTSATSTRRAACRSPNIMPRSSAPRRVRVAYVDADGKQARDRGGRAARHLPAARDRPSQRRAVHRLSLQAEARHGDPEIHQGGEARLLAPRRRTSAGAGPPAVWAPADGPARRLHGHAGLRPAGADRDRRPGPRGRGRLYPAAGAGGPRHGPGALARACSSPTGSASRSSRPASFRDDGRRRRFRLARCRCRAWSSPMA